MNKTHKGTRKGFTLLEILLVIAAIGILAVIVLVAINPNRQIAQVRNAQRRSDVNTLYKALEQYLIDNQSYPAGIENNTPRDICINGNTTNCVNLGEGILVPDYLAAIPIDPQGGAYRVSRNSDNNRISVTAPDTELGQRIAINFSCPSGQIESSYGASCISLTVTSITSAGSNTWLVPSGVSSIRVLAWGGGGGGGAATTAGRGGGGGGGAAYAAGNVSVQPNQSISYQVGFGGGSSSNGSSTVFGENIIVATGGRAGGANGGPGIPGSDSESTGEDTSSGAYGGGGTTNGGFGGSSGGGGGGGGGSRSNCGSGNMGGQKGGGGGGGFKSSSGCSNQNGGNGGSGWIELQYYIDVSSN